MGNEVNSLIVPWTAFCFLILLVIIYLQMRFSEAPFIKKNLKKYLILRNLESVYKPYLSQYFSFYNSLLEKDKLLFEKRVQKFIDIKTFIPRGRIKEISPEMKATIAGCAIQLTFGYPDVYFRHFWRILVYPDSYYSVITRKFHKGEVNPGGIIALSWKSFKDGFANPSDGHNLGFHEMAHALRLTCIVENEEYDFYDRETMSAFELEAHNETAKIKFSKDHKSVFSNYNVANVDEFFSIAVECFFEKPLEFKDYNPKLFTLLSVILKIDPTIICKPKESRNLAS